MILYTTKDLIDNTIFNYPSIRSLRKKRYFEDIQLIDGKYYFSQNDLDKLISSSNFCKNSFSIIEAAELLGFSKSLGPYYLIRKYDLQEGQDYICLNSKNYFNKDVIKKLIDKNNITYDDAYISVPECNKIISKKSYIYDGIRKGYLNEYKFEGTNEKFITKEDFKKIQEELNVIHSSYSINDIADYLGVKATDLSREQLSKLEATQIRQRLYFNKAKIDKLYEKYKTPTQAYEQYFAKAYKVKTRKKYDVPLETSIPEGYLTVNRMCEKFDTTRDILLLCIKKKQCTNVVKVNNIFYMNPSEYETILEKMNKSIASNDIYNKVFAETGIKLPIQNSGPLKKIFPTAFMWNEFGIRHYRVPKKDFEQFMKTDFEQYKIKYLTEHENNAHNVFEILFTTLNNVNLQKTLYEFNIFATDVLNKSNSITKKLIAYALYSTIKEVISRLDKDFNKLDDAEIEKIILDLPTRCKLHFSNFLNRYKKLNPDDCNYTNDYNNYTKVEPNDTNDQFYSKEEWFKYLNYLCDVDIHIINAFDRQSYARRWLYLILHFCTAFRKSTYATLPNIINIDIDKYDLQWFKDNEFALADAQYIVNNAKLFYDNTVANKNSVKDTFIVYPCMLIPVAIALICAEKHSRTNKSALIGQLTSSKSDFAKYFGDNMDGFTSSKANRTLLTCSYFESANKEGYTGISYLLASVQRGHTINKMGVAPVTHQYIYSTNQDGDATNVAYQLHRRGVFGWLFKEIVTITNNNSKGSITETTDKIEDLKSVLSVKNIEGISKFLEDENFKSQNVISELLAMNSYSLEELLKKLMDFKLPSKIHYTQCIKSNECPYPTNTSCYICKYSIPTNYTLIIINAKLIQSLDKLDNCAMEDEGERIYYSNIILKLLRIINQAKEDFKNYDVNNKEYINSFLDINLIKEKFDKIKNSKLLIK